jgi:hypothetical protein
MRGAVIKKLVELFGYFLRSCRQVSAIIAGKRAHLYENIVTGSIRIGMTSVEMDVAGARAMKTIGKDVAGRNRLITTNAGLAIVD